MSSKKEYGVAVLLDALGTRERIQNDIDSFLTNWDSVLNQLEANVEILEQQLRKNGYRMGIRIKDIFDNIQIFYATDDPYTAHLHRWQLLVVVNSAFCGIINKPHSLCNDKRNIFQGLYKYGSYT